MVLRDQFDCGNTLRYSNGELFSFVRTHWTVISSEQLGSTIISWLSKSPINIKTVQSLVRAVIDLIKMKQATGIDIWSSIEDLPIINVSNGELWFDEHGNVELRPHDPASGLRYCLDVFYDPLAQCNLYNEALSEIFSTSRDCVALTNLWHEFAGYLLQPARPDARIFIGWGTGGDGKSSLAGLLVRLVGRDRVASLPLEKLMRNRFMIGHLNGKALLLDDDVAVGTVLPDGLLKTISEAKVITGELKHKDAVEYQIRATPLLLCNEVPILRDISYGFRRRLIVIPFERHFSESNADRTLFTRIWANERSGVLNCALAGLQRLAGRGWKFEPPEAVATATELWWRQAIGEREQVSSRKPNSGSERRAAGKARKQGLPASLQEKPLELRFFIDHASGNYSVEVHDAHRPTILSVKHRG